MVFNRIFESKHNLERTENAFPSKAREVSEVNPASALSFSSLWAEVTNPSHPNDHPNHLYKIIKRQWGSKQKNKTKNI